MSWIAEFFRTIPDALRALYQFGDPSGVGDGWWGVLIVLIWGVFVIGGPLAIARATYGKREWVSAFMGTMGGLGILWWVFGILPSAWIYYVDSNKEILADRMIPTSLRLTFGGVVFPIATNLYDVLRDLVVVIEHLIALGAVFWAALEIQKRYPRGLAPGEEKSDATGGYK